MHLQPSDSKLVIVSASGLRFSHTRSYHKSRYTCLEAAVFQDLSISGAKASHISKIAIFMFVLFFCSLFNVSVSSLVFIVLRIA
jgi:hypothetical protein